MDFRLQDTLLAPTIRCLDVANALFVSLATIPMALMAFVDVTIAFMVQLTQTPCLTTMKKKKNVKIVVTTPDIVVPSCADSATRVGRKSPSKILL